MHQTNLDAQAFSLSNEESGVNHVFRQNGFIGGGAAFFDADNDGDDDLYVTSGSEIDRFFLNNGDGTFQDKTFDAGFFQTIDNYTTSVSVGDVNNDGYQDLFVCTRGNVYQTFTKNFLYLNLKDGSFEDIWAQFTEDDLAYSMGSTFIDYNQDGLLDVYITNYIQEGAFLTDSLSGEIIGYDHTCFDNFLYKNIDGLSFERQMQSEVADGGCSLAVVASDIDSDKDLDLFVANDFGEFIVGNKLYESNGGENFTEVSSSFGMDQAIYGMGIANGDYDNDGDFDYYVTNFGSNLLLENQNGQFSDVALSTGCDDTWMIENELLSISWGCIFADFNNDRFLDLYVANGWVPSPSFIPSAIGQEDALFMNNNGESFERSFTSGISNRDVSRGVCYSDFDNDGDVDVFVVSQTVPLNGGGWSSKLFKNETTDLGNYLQIKLIGNSFSTDAFGTTVEIYSQGQSFIREHNSGSSHASQNSSVLHFGLDTLSLIDSLKVNWLPESFQDTCYYNIEVNQKLVITTDSIFKDLDFYSINIDTMNVDTMNVDTMNIDTMIVDTTSFNEFDFDENQLNLFPNPTEEKLFISSNFDLKNCKVEIINANGISTEVALENEIIYINQLPSGIYFLSIKCEGSSVVKKFIKTN